MKTTAANDINGLCDFVRETAFAIHRYHRHGHLEKVYENALAHRLRKAGLKVHQQYPLNVLDEDGTSIGEYFADLIIRETLIVELKACHTLVAEHVAQMLGYLRSAKKGARSANELLRLQVPDSQIRDAPRGTRSLKPFSLFCAFCAFLRLFKSS